MLAADQLVKGWVRSAILIHGSLGGKPFPGFFELTLTYNSGIAFGLLRGKATLMTPIAIAIAGGASWYSWKHPMERPITHVAMGLLASGALGNLSDRLFDPRGVTDMFWFRAIDFPVFNVADSCITVATVLLVVSWWMDAIKSGPTKIPAIETPRADAE
jgi:signal peptidase II